MGTALGPQGVNIMDFCKNFNAKTAKDEGLIIPVVVTVYADRSYTFITKTPPAAILLKRAANIAKGSAEPNKNKVGHGDREAGRRDREDEDARPELRVARGRHQDGRGHGPFDGPGRDRVGRAPAAMRNRGHAEPRARHRRMFALGRGAPAQWKEWESLRGSFAPQESTMRKRGRKFAAARAQVAIDRTYTIEEAIPLMQKVKFAKFDETVELALRLGVDPKHADQMVRGTVVLPHGLGKSKRVLAIAGGEKQKEAHEAGADVVGGEEIVEKIQGGFMDFDAVVATPDMMRAVGKLGKVLGPRGLMPNPKTGTVTADIARPSGKSRPARWSSASTRPASSTRRSARCRLRPIRSWPTRTRSSTAS